MAAGLGQSSNASSAAQYEANNCCGACKYGRVAFFTRDGGTASPPEGRAHPAKLVKIEIELFAETTAT